MYKKPIKTYNQQMRLIRKKGISCHGSKDKNLLIRHGYFSLVNAYKKPFIRRTDASGDHEYFSGTAIDHFIAVKFFDSELRGRLFVSLCKIEEEMKTIFVHIFGHDHELDSLSWTNTRSYEPSISEFDKMSLISHIYHNLDENRKREYLKHYCENHKEIPLWVMAKSITLGHFIHFVTSSRGHLVRKFCDLYGISHDGSNKPFKLLKSILNWMRVVRNSCAHNERIYDMKSSNNLVRSKFHNRLPSYYTSDVRGGRKKRIADLLLYFKYFLRGNEYTDLLNDIENQLLILKGKIPINPYSNVLNLMGIENDRFFEVIRSDLKRINYNILK